MMQPVFDQQMISRIFTRFITGKEFISFAPVVTGHINDSFKIISESGEPFLLQRINHHIFRDIPGLTANILAVTRHLEAKIWSGDPDAQAFEILKLIPAQDDLYYYRDTEGNYWRLFNFIPGTHTYDIITDPLLAEEGGRAFGRFQYLLSDLPAETLTETIPRFHDIGWRLEQFRDALARDPAKRSNSCRGEIEFVRTREEEMTALLHRIRSGEVPPRVTHNDTKFNNILFNEDGEAVCIVDLDTVMPGSVLYDFGDAIRTGANTGAEDEKDAGKVSVDLNLFEAYTRGYLSVARKFLTGEEIAHLAFSARYMTFIIGLRFLTDHLAGDRYFRIRFPGHNLQRARAQFRLLESIEERRGEMEEVINKIMSNE